MWIIGLVCDCDSVNLRYVGKNHAGYIDYAVCPYTVSGTPHVFSELPTREQLKELAKYFNRIVNRNDKKYTNVIGFEVFELNKIMTENRIELCQK